MRLGTRTSDLAMTQSGMVARAIGPDVVLVGITTEGDRLVDVPLRGPLEKGYFTAELERQLLAGDIDVAVHSMKDLPVAETPGTALGAVPERAPVSDLLIARKEAVDPYLPGLPLREGARVGAASERRQALVRTARADLVPAFLRGNVPTRVRRLAEGAYEAILLAEAGVERLGLDLSAFRVYRLDPRWWPPAPGQGALAVQCRAKDIESRVRLAAIHDIPSERAVVRERQWLGRIGGGCATPFGAYVNRARWSIGMMGADGRMRTRHGDDLNEGERALAALIAGGPGEAPPATIWKEVT